MCCAEYPQVEQPHQEPYSGSQNPATGHSQGGYDPPATTREWTYRPLVRVRVIPPWAQWHRPAPPARRKGRGCPPVHPADPFFMIWVADRHIEPAIYPDHEKRRAGLSATGEAGPSVTGEASVTRGAGPSVTGEASMTGEAGPSAADRAERHR
jgi:hypothetical protein